MANAGPPVSAPAARPRPAPAQAPARAPVSAPAAALPTEALSDLKTAALCCILSFLIIPILIAWYFTGKGLKALSKTSSEFHTGRMLFRVGLLLILIGFIVLLLFVLTPFLLGSGSLVQVSAPTYGSQQVVVNSLAAGVSAILGVIALACFIFGALILIIGLAVSFYKVGKVFSNDLVKIGGILLLFGPLTIVAGILIFIGIGEVLNRQGATAQ